MSDMEKLLEDVAVEIFRGPSIAEVLKSRLLPLLEAGQGLRDRLHLSLAQKNFEDKKEFEAYKAFVTLDADRKWDAALEKAKGGK